MSCAASKIRVACAPLVALLLALALAPNAARAYSDGAAFDVPALEGGGGGRHFTGSSADGYSCAVCHGAVSAAPPTIDGLPTGGFESGVRYALLVRFAPDARRAGLALELVDAQGAAAGTIALDGAGEADELCRADGTGATPRAASVVTPTSPGRAARSVVVVDACGASAVRLLWTAPTSARGSVFVEAGYVRSDGTGGPDGDATAQLEVQIAPLNVPADARVLDGGCAVSPMRSSRCDGTALLCVALIALVARRRAIRRH